MGTAVLELPKRKVEEKPKKTRRERGEGMLFLRGRVWWVQYYVQGRAIRESTSETVKEAAKRFLQRKLVSARDGNIADGRLTYEAMRDYLYADYRTHNRKSMLKRADGTEYIGAVPALDEFFAGYRASAITTEAMKEFIRKRQADSVGNGGINGSLVMLRRMFWLQVKERKFPRNLVPYFPLLEKPKPRRDFLTPDQHAKILKHLPDDLRPLQTVAYDTGARKSELLRLTWEKVNLKTGTLLFTNTKNGEDRTVPVGAAALRTLRALRKQNPNEEFVFTRNGKPIRNFRRAWDKACESAGLNGHLFHGNRRSQAVNLMAAGVDEQIAMDITGHKDTQTFRGYRVLVEHAKRAAIAKRDAK